MGWYLLNEIARAMGVSIEKVSSAREVSLLLELARTVKRLEGMTDVEMDTGFDPLRSESKPLAGHRVLVINNDKQLRMAVTALSRNVGLVVDFVPSTSKLEPNCLIEIASESSTLKVAGWMADSMSRLSRAALATAVHHGAGACQGGMNGGIGCFLQPMPSQPNLVHRTTRNLV